MQLPDTSSVEKSVFSEPGSLQFKTLCYLSETAVLNKDEKEILIKNLLGDSYSEKCKMLYRVCPHLKLAWATDELQAAIHKNFPQYATVRIRFSIKNKHGIKCINDHATICFSNLNEKNEFEFCIILKTVIFRTRAKGARSMKTIIVGKELDAELYKDCNFTCGEFILRIWPTLKCAFSPFVNHMIGKDEDEYFYKNEKTGLIKQFRVYDIKF